MTIAKILDYKGSDFFSIKPDVTVQDAIRELAERRVGALVVSENGKTIDGILSERDVVRCQADGTADVKTMPVTDLMTRKVYTCTSETTVTDAMEIMDRQHIRHIPVLKDDTLAGLVSVRDVISAKLRELEIERQQMQDYITGGLSVG